MIATDSDIGKRDANVVQRYVDARAEQDRLEAELKKAKEKVEAAAHRVLDLYVENGWQNVKVGNRLVYLSKATYARPKNGVRDPALLAALREHGYGDLIRDDVSASSLSALVREHAANDDELPEAITELLAISEVFDVKMKKG